jgi:molecular chaperone GrpE
MESTDNQKIELKIEELQKQNDEYLNGWKRAKADLVNLQNDMARERIEWAQFASAKTLSRLLPAIDTLEAAAVHNPELADTVRKFEEYLKGEGIAEIDCAGKYDPVKHEVVSMEKREGEEHGTIVGAAQKGYTLHEKILRPAKVIIAE